MHEECRCTVIGLPLYPTRNVHLHLIADRELIYFVCLYLVIIDNDMPTLIVLPCCLYLELQP
jgi:hypothetical protein